MKLFFCILLNLTLFTSCSLGKSFHVSINGKDANSGTSMNPFRTIQHAADMAQPGDTIIVHEGIYREYINPSRGGISDSNRIVYEAAPGEKVIIKGSEMIKNWNHLKGSVWQVKIPNSFFGAFNPYSDTIYGDWYHRRGRSRHTGAVYLNGRWLSEAAQLKDVFTRANGDTLWFGKVNKDSTTIWAQFRSVNPNKQLVEINVRQSIFYPKDSGIDYITVRGFTMEQAATPWAPPTAEQIGVIGTNWSKGWIIENNVIKYSMCSGITLGKYGDKWDNTAANTAKGYVKTIQRASKHGWTKENIGHHIVRNNVVSHCEQAGIVGSLGAVFSIITGNTVHDICSEGWLGGFELAGIKIHAAVDVNISKNYIYHTTRGIFLDWMAQGTRVSGNFLHDNINDMYIEVNHGPFMVDNNIFLSPVAIIIHASQGGAFCHNLFAGSVIVMDDDKRRTPILKAHSTAVERYYKNPKGDIRFYNNIFAKQEQLGKLDEASLPSDMLGNIYLNGALPSLLEKNPVVVTDFNPEIKLIEKSNGLYLRLKLDKKWVEERKRPLITTALLGKTAISNQYFEQPGGKPIQISFDYFHNHRNKNNPAPGPFENFKSGINYFKLWIRK